MTIARLFVALAAMLALAASSLAETGNVSVGSGAIRTCGDWARVRAEPRQADGGGSFTEIAFLHWIQGYVSGANLVGTLSAEKPVVGLPNSKDLSVWIDGYCAKRRTATLEIASKALVEDLWAKVPRSSNAR